MTTAAARSKRRGSAAGVMARVVLVTGAVAVLGFALGGLLGIIVLATMNATGVQQNMYLALYAYAMPGAIVGAMVGFAAIVWSEWKTRAK